MSQTLGDQKLAASRMIWLLVIDYGLKSWGKCPVILDCTLIRSSHKQIRKIFPKAFLQLEHDGQPHRGCEK